MRLFNVLLFLGCFSLVTPQGVDAATVTVNPNQDRIAGENYQDIISALGNFRRGDAWGNGAGDTVLVYTGIYLMGVWFENQQTETLDAVIDPGDGTLSIKAAEGHNPVLALDPDNFTESFMYFRRQGDYLLQGLTFIGEDNAPTIHEVTPHRAVLKADSEDAQGVQVKLTVRDCVFTKNNGSSAPVMDFTGPIPTDSTNGCTLRAFWSGESTNQGTLDVLFDRCVIAYSNSPDGPIRVDRIITDCTVKRNVTFRHVLFVSNRRVFRTNTGLLCNTSYTFEGCAFINHPTTMVRFTDSIAGASVVFRDCIFSSQPSGTPESITLEDAGFFDLTVERCTFWNNNSDMIYCRNGTRPLAGQDKITLRDIIDVNGNDSILLYRPREDEVAPGAQPALLVVGEGIASDNAVRTTLNDNIEAKFAALYNGSGPIKPVPLSDFSNTTFSAAIFSNIRQWDKETNDFFDISPAVAAKYQSKGSNGSNLSGGGDFPAVAPSNVDNWSLYRPTDQEED